MRKVVFVSFADTRYRASLDRLKKETEDFGFTERYFFTEEDLPSDFFDGFSPKIYRRGYGYWIWKPYIIKKVLEKMNDGEILVYSDSGNRWCVQAIDRFNEYLSMLSSEKPLVAFQQQFLEKEWTKGDVFQYICQEKWKEYAVTLQVWSGSFLLINNKETRALINAWNDIAQNHRNLFTDKASVFPNTGYFQENRHDQSCFSLLVKQMPHTEISWREVDDLDWKWESFGSYPIQAKRARSLSKKKKYFTFIYHMLIGLYLKHFKNFYFNSRVAWSVIIIFTTALLSFDKIGAVV